MGKNIKSQIVDELKWDHVIAALKIRGWNVTKDTDEKKILELRNHRIAILKFPNRKWKIISYENDKLEDVIFEGDKFAKILAFEIGLERSFK